MEHEHNDPSKAGGGSPRPVEEGPGEEFWKVARPPREPLDSRWFPIAVIATLTVATPWYLPEELAHRVWEGLPLWVWIALGGAVVLSCLTAVGALALWREDDSEGRTP